MIVVPHGTGQRAAPGHRRARRSFWLLVVIAIAATGSLTGAVGAPSGPLTGVWFVSSALVVAASLTLAVRVLAALGRPGDDERGPLRPRGAFGGGRSGTRD